jgi:endonuclease YncB( thermonuclease family)
MSRGVTLSLRDWGQAKERFGMWRFSLWKYRLHVRLVEDGYAWALARSGYWVAQGAESSLDEVGRAALSAAKAHAWQAVVPRPPDDGLPL